MPLETATCVEVDLFAVGDGKADDTVAIRKAIATGKHLRLTRGKTYLYSGNLLLKPGQIVYGEEAILKRRAQVQTTTATSITAGQTRSIDVADASVLIVGMDIAVAVNAATYDL